MNAALSLADTAAEERPLPIRARLALRMPAFLFGLGMVIYPLLTVLDRLAGYAPREMRRTLLAAFGNAKLAGHDQILNDDVAEPRGAKKVRIGF